MLPERIASLRGADEGVRPYTSGYCFTLSNSFFSASVGGSNRPPQIFRQKFLRSSIERHAILGASMSDGILLHSNTPNKETEFRFSEAQ
jgi:hypothetical protein